LLESEVVLSLLDNVIENGSRLIYEETAAFEKVYGELDAQIKEVELMVQDVNENGSRLIYEETAAFEKVYGKLDAQIKEVELMVQDVNAK
jgi:hypothetical protein